MKQVQELIKAGQYLLRHKLAWGTSGNLSAKVDEERMLISASGAFMGNLSSEDFVKFNIFTNEKKGERKASKETPMHSGIYKKRKDVNVVLHSSPFYTTFFACGNDLTTLSELFIETMYYLEHIAYVDYFHPGTQELGDAVAEQAAKANIIMMKNHGVIVCDASVWEAVMRLETLEMACRMILKAKETGTQLTRIPETVVKDFLENSRYKPRKNLSESM